MEGLCSLNGSCIWTDHNQVVFVNLFCLEEIGKACKGCFIVLKLTLGGYHAARLGAVQVNSYYPRGSHMLNHLRNVA